MERILAELRLEVERLAHCGRLKSFSESKRSGFGSTHVQGRSFVDFTNFDVLGMSGSREVQRAVHQAIDDIGLSNSASRLSSGTTAYHTACERRLSQFFGFESALLFSSKNQAVLSLVTGLLTERDTVFFEELIQSPIADAAYLINCPALPFSISNLEALDSELAKSAGLGHKLIFAEGVAAMTGVSAPLSSLCLLARKHGAALVIDESFAVAILGPRGAGSLDAVRADVGPEILSVYCDLSLAIGLYGAALIVPAVVKATLVNRSRSVAVESPLPAFIASGVSSSLDKIEVSLSTRAMVCALAEKLRLGLRDVGLAPLDSQGPIVSCLVNDSADAAEFVRGLLERGFLVEAFPLPPSFRERAVLRFVMTAQHSEVQVQTLLQAVADIRIRIAHHRR